MHEHPHFNVPTVSRIDEVAYGPIASHENGRARHQDRRHQADVLPFVEQSILPVSSVGLPQVVRYPAVGDATIDHFAKMLSIRSTCGNVDREVECTH